MKKGFTLIEIITVIVLLGIISSVAVLKYIDLSDEARETATIKEMQNIKKAIVGYSENGVFFPGYEGDLAKLPTSLNDLITKPAAESAYDPVKKIGWNGPYINDDGNGDFLKDAWGDNYVYSAGDRELRSTNGITIKF